MIQSGDKIPSVPIKLVTADGTTDTTADVALGDGLVVLFGVPGAFTPTCDTSHLPGFVANGRKFADLGVKHVICGTVNDHHVTRAWGERSEAFGTVDFIADSHAALADAMGLSKQMGDLGKRFCRFAMIIDDGIVKEIYVQDVAGVTVSGAPAILMALQSSRVSA
jgi:peroxiredoxin